MRHMLYGSFGTQNLMVTLIFKFDPRKGQLQVKLGQIRSNFKIQNFLTKICLSCADLSQDSKMSFIFMYDNQKCQKMNFKNVTSSSLPDFLAIAQPKTKILLCNFVCVLLFVCILIKYIPFFWMTQEFWILQAIIFEKLKF